jgi:LysM repeat protein
MIIQYILKEKKKEQDIQICYVLPVTPTEIKKSKSASVSSIALLNYGAVTSNSNRDLEQIQFSSFFPSKEYEFVKDNIQQHNHKMTPYDSYRHKTLLKPEEYIQQFQTLVNTGKPFSINIDTLVPIWKYYVVKNFQYSLDDGSGDINYTMTLLEYRTPNIVKSETKSTTEGQNRESKLPQPEIYVVKKGDTLWGISKRFTGNGMNWKKIAKDNGVDNPRLLQIGKELKIQ